MNAYSLPTIVSNPRGRVGVHADHYNSERKSSFIDDYYGACDELRKIAPAPGRKVE